MFFRRGRLKHKLLRLLVPYVCFYILCYLFLVIKQLIKHETIDYILFFKPFCGGTLWSEAGPLWFLLVLAEIYVIVNWASKYIQNDYLLLAVSVTLSWVSYFLGSEFGPMLYYCGVAILCMPFFIFGKIIVRYLTTSLPKYILLLALFISVASFLTQPLGCNVSMNYIPVHYLSFVSVSISVFIVLVEFSKWLSKFIGMANFWSYWGRNTLVILSTHFPFVFLAAIFNVYIPYLWMAMLFSLFIIMGIEIVIIYIVNNYGKWMLGY